MGKSFDLVKPCIFISYAWEDKALVRRLESELKAAGAEVWVDHVGVRGGDNLPKRINDALAWCNTLLLVWSKAAEESQWVELEWTNAISLQKRIIPCLHDGTPLPPILANKVYVNFANEANGLRELLATLQLEPPSREAGEIVASPANVSQTPVIQTSLAITKPSPKKSVHIKLRATPVNLLSITAVQQMLQEKGFYDRTWNSSGYGMKHQYESIEHQDAQLVIDHLTGLVWQKSGSENYLIFTDIETYLRQLNVQKLGGYTDWRLPTLEEAMSLMEREKMNGELYIDPVFDKTQWWIWTADKERVGRSWFVYFDSGSCGPLDIVSDYYVRAVRS